MVSKGADGLRYGSVTVGLTCCTLGTWRNSVQSFCWTSLSFGMSFCATTKASLRAVCWGPVEKRQS